MPAATPHLIAGAVSPGEWALAALPLAALLVLTMIRACSTILAALAVVALTVVIVVLVHGGGAELVGTATGKGVWLGLWISYVVAPALLLYRIAAPAGLHRIGDAVAALSSNPLHGLLLVAWLLPSLIQGIAGFGAPIALVAPLLVSMGYSPVRAVVYPLVGYCWSVTFGSMASSFYMAGVTAGLDHSETAELALRSSLLLAGLALVSPLLLCLMEGGIAGVRRTLPFISTVWVVVAGALVGTAQVVPAMASVTAAGGGLLVALGLILARDRANRTPRDDQETRLLLPLALPYLALLAVTLPVFLLPWSRDWVRTHLEVAPSFPETSVGDQVNPEVVGYTPLAVLGHPGSYVLLACAVGWLVYRRYGLWAPDVTMRSVVTGWARSVPSTVVPIVALTVLSALLVDSGMTTTLAVGVAGALGVGYPIAAAALGATGAFMSGSSTSSNALFSGFQAETALLIDAPPTALLAAQTVGANVGNSVAPVIVATGLGSVGAPREGGRVIREVLPAALVLLVLATALVCCSVWWLA